MKTKLNYLDVHGNDEDGFEVNDVLSTDLIDSSELEDFTAFCKTYLRGDPKQYKIVWHGDDSGEVSLKVNGRPILNFELVQINN